MSVLRIAITPGEPAGIGPDLTVQLAQHSHNVELVAIADPQLLLERAAHLQLPLTIRTFDADAPAQASVAGELCVQAVPLYAPCTAGQLNAANAQYV